MSRGLLLPLLLVLALAVAGCGGGEPESPPPDNAVEATEENVVELAGVTYRVVGFRELNPAIAPDDALFEGRPPGDDRGLYGLFLTACNRADGPQTTTASVRLEDAFGETFEPLGAQTVDRYEYQPVTLDPGACTPGEGSVAERLVDGAALLFSVPFDDARERPLIAELDAGGERRRIQLDL